MPLVSGKTAYFVDFDVLRELIRKEIAVRAGSVHALCRDTGISSATMSNFLGVDNKNPQSAMSADTLATVMRWGNFAWGDVIKRRKGFGTRHTDTKDQSELRAITKLLEDAGVKLQDGESVSQMLARVIGSTPVK